MREIANFMGDDIRAVERNYYDRHPDYLHSAADWPEREAGAEILRTVGAGRGHATLKTAAVIFATSADQAAASTTRRGSEIAAARPSVCAGPGFVPDCAP
jgi:hypothetical protein